jgi:uncharacterized membrane protein YkoI
MRHDLHRYGLCGLAVALLLAGAPAWSDSDQDRARAAVESGEVKPLKQILKSVRKAYKGEVLDAELLDLGGFWMYRVRVLSDDGQVYDLGVDGRSGEIVDVRGGGS